MAPGRQVRNMAVPMAYASSRSAKTTSRTTTGKRFPSRGQSLDVFELDEKHARGRRANGEDGEEANYEIQSVAIDSADDEEISEDEAFDDEDEERWGDFFRGSATEAQKVRCGRLCGA